MKEMVDREPTTGCCDGGSTGGHPRLQTRFPIRQIARSVVLRSGGLHLPNIQHMISLA
jgi:hypothetical protein